MAQLHKDSLDLNAEIEKLVCQQPFDSKLDGMFVGLFEKALFNRSSEKKDELPGAVILLPRADGFAIYICVKARPLILRHIYLSDGYQVDYCTIRGMRFDDILERRHINDGVRGHIGLYGAELVTDEHRQTVKDILHRLLPSLF